MENGDERRLRSQKLHQESQKQYEREQNALCFIVLGGIFLIIGIFFIFLANKRENNVMTGMDVTSLAFYIFLFGTIGGSGATIYGIVKLIRSHLSRNGILREINSLDKGKEITK
jgi:hypothetical protein